MRKTVVWLWGPDVDERFPKVLAALLGAGEPLTKAPTAEDVDLGNPLAPNSVLVVNAALTSDDIEQLHDAGVITPQDTHFVRIASFEKTGSATSLTSVHGRQPQPTEQYAQTRGYKPRLVIANAPPEEQIANLLVTLGLDSRVR